MNTESAIIHLPPRIERSTLNWDVVAEAYRHARVLRALAFTRAFLAPWVWLRDRVERARAPLDFEPIGT